MSALAQQNPLFSVSVRRISEIELLRAISNITWNADCEEQGLASIAAAVLRVPGLNGFRFEPFETFLHLPIYETSRPLSKSPSASAVSSASANGQTWGQIRIFFDPHASPALESPVRLAKFIGQQIGILLHRIALHRERAKHLSRLETLDRVIRRRKLIHRAAGILAEQRDAPEAEAISIMVRHARRNRRNLLQIAESLIFGYDTAAFNRPSLRRLGAHELTSSQTIQRSPG
jgi:hypothetical protein